MSTIFRLGPIIALAVASLSLVSACSKDVLDYRNAEISNGKVFANGKNEPFSGHLTDIPDNQLLSSQPGFLAVAGVIVLAMDKSGMAGENGIAGADASYVLHNQSFLCEVDVRDGVFDGEAKCKAPNSDSPATQASFSKGKLDGAFALLQFEHFEERSCQGPL